MSWNWKKAVGGIAGAAAGSIFGPVGSSIGAGLVGSFFGSDDAAASGVQGAQGVLSNMNGSDPSTAGAFMQGNVSGSQAKRLIQKTAMSMIDSVSNSAGGLLSRYSDSQFNDLFSKSAGQKGSDLREYLAQAFPELNPWERSGASSAGVGGEIAGQDNAVRLKQMELNNAKDIAKLNADKDLKIAGIQSATSRQNTADQVYAQNELLQSNKSKNEAEVGRLLSVTGLTEQQRINSIVDYLIKQYEVQGVQLGNEQKRELINKTREEISKIKYGEGTIMGQLRQGYNVTDYLLGNAPSKIVGFFHNFLNDPLDYTKSLWKSNGGVKSSMSR